MKTSNTIRYKLEYWGLLFIVVPWYYLPRQISLALGSALGWIVAHILPIRRSVVESNLRRAFPHKSPREINKLTINTYRHFGRMIADFVRQDRYSASEMRKMVTMENRELLENAIADDSGAVLLLGHFGNWEIFGRWLGFQQDFQSVALERPQNNPFVSDFITTKRKVGNLNMMSIFESTASFLSVLQDGKVLMMLADQDARKRGAFVDFFDIPSSTPRGAAVFAHRVKAPVILVFPIMRPDKTYHFIFEELTYSGITNGNAVNYILQQYMKRLQFHVSQHPEQYFWFHRRWKTQPAKQSATDSVAPSLAGAAG
ncbi:MAG: hypothetical protein K9N46_10200 [Candidatus Marinimicrobia bacterium]|nr:hypothetical protein [Candidatus Neomarinimicrobiota bacterium]MCF7829251.1 hypothetical protein [Candidatus Neomarinimicrobiota bacterium]MCF7881096.1 hypothetical protein [Candidatus Neomarinimicrobiota bacterium]